MVDLASSDDGMNYGTISFEGIEHRTQDLVSIGKTTIDAIRYLLCDYICAEF